MVINEMKFRPHSHLLSLETRLQTKPDSVSLTVVIRKLWKHKCITHLNAQAFFHFSIVSVRSSAWKNIAILPRFYKTKDISYLTEIIKLIKKNPGQCDINATMSISIFLDTTNCSKLSINLSNRISEKCFGSTQDVKKDIYNKRLKG